MRGLLLVPLALGGLAGLTVGVCVGIVRYAARGRLYQEAEVPARSTALVLGAQVHPDGTPSRFLLGRLELARRLYDAGRVRRIIVSGDSLAPEWDEPAAMRRHLLTAGVPDSAIVEDTAGFDTYDSCVRAKLVFGVPDVIVVSQSYHLPRAVGTAQLIGLDAVGVGDHTVRQYLDGGRTRPSRAWRRGAVRDQIACVKTILDVVTRRRPVLNLKPSRGQRAAARS